VTPMEVALFLGRHVHQLHQPEEIGGRSAHTGTIRALPRRFGAPAAPTGGAAAVPPPVGDMACTIRTLPPRFGAPAATSRGGGCSSCGSRHGVHTWNPAPGQARRSLPDSSGPMFGIDLRREFFHPATGFHKARVSLLTRQGRRNTFPSLALVKPCGRAPKNSRPDPRPALATVVPQPVTMAG